MPALPADLSAIIAADIERALAEDVGAGDVTASLIPQGTTAHAKVITRERAILAGTPWFDAVFRRSAPTAKLSWHAVEGATVEANQTLVEIDGDARGLLTAERTALNFVQTLSAVASKTRQYVELVRGTRAKILDTRKTLPGLRMALKYAVMVGGGVNHRIGLFDAVLIKENHIIAAGGIRPALQAAFALAKTHSLSQPVQVEVETLDQLQEALDCGCKLILIDNFSLDNMRKAVQIAGDRAELEASGGVNLDTVRQIAETGVHRISIGALTKDIKAVDLSMRFTFRH